MTVTTIHCFEERGLGKAPFRYVGMEHQEMAYGERVLGIVGGATVTTKPGGTCDYCGTYIVNIFRIESADGKAFKVGCECVRKTGDEGLIRRVEADVKKQERQRRLDKKQAKLKAEREYCEATLPKVAWKLAEKPHPSATLNSMGKTLFDWARWMMQMKHYGTLAATLRREME